MASLGNAYVNIIADAKKLKPGLDKARKTVSSSIDKMGEKIKTLTFNAAIIGAAAFSAAVIYNMKKAVDAASDLEEVTAKFGTVYKDQIGIAEKNAKALVDSYGLSTRASKEYLGAMQDLLVPMGMASASAAKMSNEVVQLSVDLGSFNNLETATVMRDIQSALVGNFETMKKYGVVLNEAVVTQEAMTSGLITSKDQINANIKAQAAYQLIVKGSTFAIGDWARTSGGFANQMKQLTSNIEDLRAELGNHLLPIITPIIKGMNDWIKANKEIITQTLKDWAEGAAIAFQKLGNAIKFAGEYLVAYGDTFKALGLASTGVITYTEALTNASEAIEKFNKLDMRYPIGAETEGYEIYKPTEEIPIGGDNTEADKERLALLNEQYYAANMERLGLLAEIQEQEMAMWIEQNNLQIEMEKELQGQSIMQATEAAQAKLNNYIAYTNAEIKAEIEKEKFKKKLARAGFNQALNDASLFFQQMGQQSRTAFEVFKGIEIAKTIVSTIEGAQLAFAAGMSTGGPWAPAVAAAYAGAALAAGYARVSAIMSQTPDGGGGMPGGGGSVGTYSASSATGLPTSGVTDYNTKPEEEEKRGTLTINIQGDFIGDESYIDMLVERINDADDRDVFINQTNYARALS